MKKLFVVSILVASCYTKTAKPDYAFMDKIKQQAALAPRKRTSIEIIPKKVHFRYSKNSEKLDSFFYIKNNGSINFNIIAIQPDCDCTLTNYQTKVLAPNDSLKVSYKINLKDKGGYISNTIAVIGNCQYGNQTFYMEGTIIKK